MKNEITPVQIEEGLAQYDAAVAWVRERLVDAGNEEDESKFTAAQIASIEGLSEDRLRTIIGGFGFLVDSVKTLGLALYYETMRREHVGE